MVIGIANKDIDEEEVLEVESAAIKAIIAIRIERLIRIISREYNLILVVFDTFTSTPLILYLC